MAARPAPLPEPVTEDGLDQLVLDCAELETLIASINRRLVALEPAVESGHVTAEHLMRLALRIDSAERGLIAIARQIDGNAAAMMRRRTEAAVVH